MVRVSGKAMEMKRICWLIVATLLGACSPAPDFTDGAGKKVSLAELGGKPLLVNYFAPWCAPCRAMAPVMEALAAGHPELRVGKVNVDQEMGLAERFGVASVPTILFFRGGNVEGRQTGALSQQALERLLQEWGKK